MSRCFRRGSFVACLLLAAISVVAQTPGVVQFVGEAPPPPSALSLWYRAPAADRPLTPRPLAPTRPPSGYARCRSATDAWGPWCSAGSSTSGCN